MIDPGSLIGAGTGLAMSVIGGIKAGKARKKINAEIARQGADNQAWYNENALSDYTQRADSQNLMRQMRDTLDRSNKRNANMAVVTGATPEQQAVAKEQANKAIGDTFANLGAQGQAWKDNITNRYLNTKANLSNAQLGVYNQQAQSGENMMQTGLNMATSGAGSAVGSLLK